MTGFSCSVCLASDKTVLISCLRCHVSNIHRAGKAHFSGIKLSIIINICYGPQNNSIIEMFILSTLKICWIEK